MIIQAKLPFAPETARVDEVDKAIQDAIDAGHEVLTPRGVMHLFGLSEAAVRKARLKDKRGVRFVLSVTDRPVSMLSLDWALKQWGPPDADGERKLQRKLQRMRSSRHMFSLDGVSYLILHPKPIAWEGPETDMHSAGSQRLESVPK